MLRVPPSPKPDEQIPNGGRGSKLALFGCWIAVVPELRDRTYAGAGGSAVFRPVGSRCCSEADKMTPVSLGDSVFLHLVRLRPDRSGNERRFNTTAGQRSRDGTALGYAPTVTNITTGLSMGADKICTARQRIWSGRRYSVYVAPPRWAELPDATGLVNSGTCDRP